MKAFGVYKPHFKTTDFVPLIFSKKKHYFIQERRGYMKYQFVRIDLDEDFEIIRDKRNLQFDESNEQYIYSYIQDNDELLIGYKHQITKGLLEIFYNSDDIFKKLRISEELCLNGQLMKLEQHRQREIENEGFNITFYKRKDNYLNANIIDSLLKQKLNYYVELFELEPSLQWEDAIATIIDKSTDEVFIERFVFDLPKLFDYLIQNNEYPELIKSIIRITNTKKSYLIENKYKNLENIKKYGSKENKKLEIIKQYIIDKNNE